MYRDEIFPRVVAAFREMSHGLFDLDVTIIPNVHSSHLRKIIFLLSKNNFRDRLQHYFLLTFWRTDSTAETCLRTIGPNILQNSNFRVAAA